MGAHGGKGPTTPARGQIGGPAAPLGPPERGQRLAWVDVARGALIILVVLYHVITVHLLSNSFEIDSASATGLAAVIAALRPLRMPLFFLISGFLANRALKRSWPELLRSKSWFFYYLYLLWLVIHTAVMIALHNRELIDVMGSAAMFNGPPQGIIVDYLVDATIAPTNLWFLYALAVYFPLAKLLSGVERWAIVAAFIAFLVSAEGWPGVGLGQLAGVAGFFFWFLLGCHFREVIARFAAGPRLVGIAVAVTLFVGAQILEVLLGHRISLLLAVASVGGCYLGVVAAASIAEHLPRTRRLLAHIGSRTLPIYVMHMPLVWVVHAIMTSSAGLPHPAAPWAVTAYTIGITAGAIGIALLLHAALGRAMPFLFALPPRPRQRRNRA